MMTELLTEAQVIQTFLEVTYSDDINEMSDRVTALNSYLARSGHMLAQAKAIHNRAVIAACEKHRDDIARMPPSIAKKLIDSMCDQENYLVDWLDRINSTCVHQSSNIRTQISFGKSQLELTKRGY